MPRYSNDINVAGYPRGYNTSSRCLLPNTSENCLLWSHLILPNRSWSHFQACPIKMQISGFACQSTIALLTQ